MPKEGARLTAVLEGILECVKFVSATVYLSIFISAIWNSIWISKINDGLYKLLDGGQDLVNNVGATAGLAWGTLISTFVLMVLLYLFGYAFVIQGIVCAIVIICAISHGVFLALTAAAVDGDHRKAIKASFVALIVDGKLKKVTDWMADNKCTNHNECNDAMESYLSLRNMSGFVMNIILAVAFAIGLLGAVGVVSAMAAVRPVNRDEEVSSQTDSQSQGDDDHVTGELQQEDPREREEEIDEERIQP